MDRVFGEISAPRGETTEADDPLTAHCFCLARTFAISFAH
jgi:hypothetical protein